MRKLAFALALVATACSPGMFEDANTSSTYFRDTVLPAISTGELEPMMSAFARESTNPTDQARLLRIFKELRPLASVDAYNCNVIAQANTNPDLNGVFANCDAKATYAKGDAVVVARLRKVGEGWQLDSVNVNSDYFSTLMEKGLPTEAAAAPAPGPAPAAPSPATQAQP